MFVADFVSQDGSANGRILRVDASNRAVTAPLSCGDNWPSDVAVDSSSNIYFLDYGWDYDDAGAGNPSATGPEEYGRLVVLPAGTSTAGTLAVRSSIRPTCCSTRPMA